MGFTLRAGVRPCVAEDDPHPAVRWASSAAGVPERGRSQKTMPTGEDLPGVGLKAHGCAGCLPLLVGLETHVIRSVCALPQTLAGAPRLVRRTG